MEIKWNVKKPLDCLGVTGTIASSEDGHYQITYNHDQQFFRLWFHSDLGYTLPLCSTNYFKFPDFNDHLIFFHQFIEKRSKQETSDYNVCGQCQHLIFRNYHKKYGFCDLVRIERDFEDICAHEEESK